MAEQDIPIGSFKSQTDKSQSLALKSMGSLPGGTDFNTLAMGIYGINGTSHPNAPSNTVINATWYSVIVLPSKVQIAVSASRMAIRGCPAGTWGQWFNL